MNDQPLVDLHLRNVLQPSSYVRLKAWQLAGSSHPITITMKSGTRAMVRPAPSTDFNVFYEVFVKRVYEPPAELDPTTIRVVYDLGGNVGFSNLFWIETFPHAQVMTYEPHPTHVDLARRNLELNNISEARVTLRPFAACTCEFAGHISDRGAESTIGEGVDGVPVRGVDFLAEVESVRIDLLKIDIEGGEYALADDPRFRQIAAAAVCMEAHPNEHRRLDQRQAVEFWLNYWSAAGYSISAHKGVLWALKS